MLDTLNEYLLETYCLQGMVPDLCWEDWQVVTGEGGGGLCKEQVAENTVEGIRNWKQYSFTAE